MTQSRTCFVSTSCGSCATSTSAFFKDLDAPSLLDLTAMGKCRKFKKGDIVFNTGDTPYGVLLIVRGKVKLFQTGRNGRERTTRLVNDGALLGYCAVLDGAPYYESAMALEDCHLCFIPADIFLRALASSQRLALRLLEILSSELRTAEVNVAEIGQKSVRERIAAALLHLKDQHGLEKDQSTLRISMTRVELAKLVGVATESLSRTLSKFQREALIALAGPKIRILDHRKLAMLARCDEY